MEAVGGPGENVACSLSSVVTLRNCHDLNPNPPLLPPPPRASRVLTCNCVATCSLDASHEEKLCLFFVVQSTTKRFILLCAAQEGGLVLANELSAIDYTVRQKRRPLRCPAPPLEKELHVGKAGYS